MSRRSTEDYGQCIYTYRSVPSGVYIWRLYLRPIFFYVLVVLIFLIMLVTLFHLT